MLALHTKNLQLISKNHGLSADEITAQAPKIPSFLEAIAKRDQGFYKVIDDGEVVEKITKTCKEVEGAYEDIVVLGIGGSALGTICLQQSLKHLFENEKPKRDYPRLHVLDNIDPALLREIEDIIDLKKTLFIVVTKSGTTPETLAQFFYFLDKCKKAKLSPHNTFIVITDPEKNILRTIAEQENITTFDIPPNVGGRFSVLTNVGLLPAKLIGINIEKLLEGARSMRDQFLSNDATTNLPFQIATIQYLLSKKGKYINVMTPYAQKLARFADWYRQLLAESIGKRMNNSGEKIEAGITPVNALGVTDQHSQSQLYNEGPNDKLHMFIKVADLGAKMTIPVPPRDNNNLGYLEGVTFNKLLTTEMEATTSALTQNDRPNITIEIEKIDEYTLGQLLMLFEGATAFLGEFFEINAYDQPGVELSKKITRKLLQK